MGVPVVPGQDIVCLFHLPQDLLLILPFLFIEGLITTDLLSQLHFGHRPTSLSFPQLPEGHG